MTRVLQGLTWDHPRAFAGLLPATESFMRENPTITVNWDRHPLRSFEATPIEDLAASYDVIILDHPFMGDAWRSQCFVDLGIHAKRIGIDAWSDDLVGPSLAIYRYHGLWAVPIDGACQIAAYRPDRLTDQPPSNLDALRRIARSHKIVLGLARPHALMVFFSICGNLGETPGTTSNLLVSDEIGLHALDLLYELFSLCPRQSLEWNSIGVLEAMATNDELVYCPYVFGFATYGQSMEGRHKLAFANVPELVTGAGSRGAVLGGTGLAVSRRCADYDDALGLLNYLTRSDVQRFMGLCGGQPVRRSAWQDRDINQAFERFYESTIATMDAAMVRPRYPSYISFQEQGAEVIEIFLRERGNPKTVLGTLNGLHSKFARSVAV